MNNERANSAMARGLFKFVSPPAVVSKRFAFKELGIVRDRLIHKEQRDFPFEVNALVIVPAVFRCGNSVANKNDRRVEIRGFRLAFVIGDEIVESFQTERFTVW